jgi:transposase InsO family protein
VAAGKGDETIPLAPGSPWENGYIESFHSRFWDEFLEAVVFEDVPDAEAKGTWFRREFNTMRPHSALGYQAPEEFSAACDRRSPGKSTKGKPRV